jgi:hypothetical protein
VPERTVIRVTVLTVSYLADAFAQMPEQPSKKEAKSIPNKEESFPLSPTAPSKFRQAKTKAKQNTKMRSSK